MSELNGLNRKYLRTQDLRRLKNVFFSSRRVVEGQYAGRHASPQRGHSVEFNDYRQYMPGDEVADIDWKVYGRSDKMFIKLFEHQSDMTVNLVVDGSASMAYAGLDGRYSKYDHACLMAAAIAFLTTKQQDKVSFALANRLLNNAAGSAFVDAYYHISPAIADRIAQSPALAAVVRLLLIPVICITKMVMAMPLLSVLLASIGVFIVVRRKRAKA